jgi:hypothetical protein
MIKPEMKNICRTRLFIILLFSLAFFLVSCVGKTDEDLILELMDRIGSYAEKKDINSIMVNLAYDYSDFEGRDKQKAKEMIEEYFRQYRGIVIHVLSTRINEINTPEASVETEVALSSGAARVFRKLVRFSTENYRLKIKLIKRNEQWQVQFAEWRYVTFDELFPESLTIFNKIFKIDSH